MAWAGSLPGNALQYGPKQCVPRSHTQSPCCPAAVGRTQQHHPAALFHSQCSRRQQLLSAGSALLHAQLPWGHVARASATAIYHEVNISFSSEEAGGEDSSQDYEDPPTYVTATGSIIAIGDLHGDMRKAKKSLQLARVAEEQEGGKMAWVGGDTVVVQLGDVLDRGDCEIGIVRLLRDLDKQARKQGGAVYMLNGNHESLNVCGDFRYVTPGAFIEAAEEFGIPREVATRNWDGCIQARAALYLPGGRIAKELSRNATVLVVNDTAFAHGGLLPTHVNYGLERMNAEVAAWMRRDKLEDEDGYASPPFLAMGDGNSVMWNRQLSRESYVNPIDRFHACNLVTQALARVGAQRLVVGHTPQMRGVNCECEGKVWRVDVGMSAGVLNAPAGVLQISPSDEEGGDVVCTILSEQLLATYDEDSAVDF